MMNTNLEADNNMMCCAGCGKAEVDEIKLMTCTACKSVRYCSVKCQREHRPKHKRACKKRAAELRDEILFRQPESNHHGDCPICCLPLPIDPKKSTIYSCCSKHICIGCKYANHMREIEQRLHPACPFCRQPAPKSQEEAEKNLMKRAEANDPVAMCEAGITTRNHEEDYDGAIKYWTKAAGLGDAESHYELSIMYDQGCGVEKDEKKLVYHREQAAIGGHPFARYNLGAIEWNNGRDERAVKHWIIAANLGCDRSLETLRGLYTKGVVRKEDYAAALRGHQASLDATKSPQREAAEKFMQQNSSVES